MTSAEAEEIARKAATASVRSRAGFTAADARVLAVEPGELDGKPTWNVRVQVTGSRVQVGEPPHRTAPVFEKRAVVVEQATGQVLENDYEYPR